MTIDQYACTARTTAARRGSPAAATDQTIGDFAVPVVPPVGAGAAVVVVGAGADPVTVAGEDAGGSAAGLPWLQPVSRRAAAVPVRRTQPRTPPRRIGCFLLGANGDR
jgi:hypothetical protein